MLGMQGMYMMMNRYLNVKSKILTFFSGDFFQPLEFGFLQEFYIIFLLKRKYITILILCRQNWNI